MRRVAVALAAVLVAAIAACGGDDSGDQHTTRSVTSEFPASVEASTPGSGGFIETPQARKGQEVPEIRYAPDGAAIFSGIHRDAYLRARTACRRLARARSRNSYRVAAAYAARRDAELWQPAFEGCIVGIGRR
jgi:hypothetical protein